MYKYRETVPGMTTSKQIHIEFVPSSQNSFFEQTFSNSLTFQKVHAREER
jgi:hypothetical protein